MTAPPVSLTPHHSLVMKKDQFFKAFIMKVYLHENYSSCFSLSGYKE